MEERIKNLLQKGYFKECVLNEKGFGTFRNPPKDSFSVHNEYLIKARFLKRDGDSVYKNNKLEGIKKYINAMIFYIKGYRKEESKKGNSNIVGYYKGLYKYTLDIYNMIEESSPYKKFVHKVLVAVKFHFLSIETKSQDNELCKNVYDLYILCQNLEDFPKLENFKECPIFEDC